MVCGRVDEWKPTHRNQCPHYSYAGKQLTGKIFKKVASLSNDNKKIIELDKQTLKILENFNIEITDNRVNLKIDLSDEDIEFLKIHPENYTIINFYSELLLILRFIRNKEDNTIGRWVYFSNQTIYPWDMEINLL